MAQPTPTLIMVVALVCFATFQHGAVGSRQLHAPSRLDTEAKLPIPYQWPGRQPNTFIAISNQVNSSLLRSGTPVLLWGAVPTTVIRQACDALVQKGIKSFDVHLQGTVNRFLELQVEAARGCHATADESGFTEFVFLDTKGRRSAVVCPNGATDPGCGIYVTGKDVTKLYNQGIQIPNGTKELFKVVMDDIDDCVSAAGSGAISGAVTGVMGTGSCWELGLPLSPFCAAGVVGGGSMVGAIAGCAKSCFPGNATVELVNGEHISMNQLRLGHKVAVLKNNGEKTFEDVYAFGHRDKDVMSEFLQIHMVSGNLSKMTLELSSLHFVPTVVHAGGGIRYKRAMDVEVDDMLLTFSNGVGSRLTLHKVTMISVVKREGLYNPFTLGGTIIVDGVVASTHSDWFLDPLFDQFGITNLLPQAYQLLLLPARCIYYLLGRQIYSSVYDWVDGKIDIAKTGTKYGSELVVAATATIFFVAMAATAHSKNYI